ncbi:restriction endonuclease [Halostagnicola sp. A-GB9-2]|uniref:restriction endonuclease n=1 Tax=Halostagnicola sp. A-GB9-2 TaxID=3048066 RepID=UPI0024BFB591|nr:restriction endonuclease [Halostagnicola sp. A-GB9-2]MDJ1434222.1 hypothetical protein [Halostagnicola sp. A-GB9-2]
MSNRDPPSREAMDGRGQGRGQWLEYQLERALRRWGYRVDRNVHVFSQEVDVVAVRHEKEGTPTDWILAQCKDWESTRITTETIYRLCLMAFTSRAMPVLCHTTALTEDARRIARHWEVRVLTLEDLHRGSLPAPNVAEPTAEYGTYETQYTAREERGSLPVLFMGEPRKQFSYVPGFTPVGRSHEYRPLNDTEHSDGSGGG